MRGKSSSRQGNCKGEGMEIDSNKLDRLKEEPHLSGAYIRSLVKQLSSSRTKDPMNLKDSTLALDGDDGFPAHHQNLIQEPQPPQQPQQHKKQVRRRLHTTRPYQERLLNMAEARKEIVTALKFHRAAMKQTNDHRQEPPPPPPPQTQSQLLQPSPQHEQELNSKSRRNPKIYPSTSLNFSNHMDNLSYQSFPYNPPQNSYSWPMSAAPPPPVPENFNLTLPNQTLGLNLNLHDFNNLDTNLFHNASTYYSPSSPSSSSSSPPLSVAISQTPLVADSNPISEGDLGLHHAMDDDEMAEIRSLGEQHQIEWNDTMNLVTSAWWFKFLKTMEVGPDQVKDEDEGFYPFDGVMEFPAWLNANDSCLQQLDDHYSSDYYFQDTALPCMDIGEIEGMGEWLA